MASLSGEILADTSGLVDSVQPNASYKNPYLRDRTTPFILCRLSSPAIDKPDVKLQKTIVDSALVKIHLVSSAMWETSYVAGRSVRNNIYKII